MICKYCHKSVISPCDENAVKITCTNYLKMVHAYDNQGDNDARLHAAQQEDEVWVTQDGRSLKVSEMHEEHVRNALRLIIRKRRVMKEQLEKKPAFRRYLALKLLHEVFNDMTAKSDASRAEMDQKLHEDIMNEIGEDKKWGGD